MAMSQSWPAARGPFVLWLCATLAACGGGGGGGDDGNNASAPVPPPAPPPAPVFAPIDPSLRVSEPSGFAAGCDGGALAGLLYAGAEVEPHVAINPVNPLNLVAAWQQNRWSGGAAQGLMAAYSLDGGLTWSRTSPLVSRCNGATLGSAGYFERATDPWVSFAPDGTAYLMALSVDGAAAGSSNAMLAARSTDGGRTWSAPATLIRDGAAAFNDKNTLTADPTDASFVYAVWDRLPAAGGGPAVFARTTNGGASWEAARVIYDPGRTSQTIGTLIVVLPNGTLALLLTQIDAINTASPRAFLRVLRSTDRGVNWSAPVTVAENLAVGAFDPQTRLAIRDGAVLAQMAVAPNGSLYVVWQDARFTSGAIDSIALARSTDGGLTWGAPVRVNGAPTAQAFTPQVAVQADGSVGVLYVDLRADSADPATLGAEFWLARSTDAGSSWRETRVAGPFDLATAPNARGLFLGDYFGLAASGTAFIPVYVQTTGEGAANRTDVFARRVPATAFVSAGQPAKAAERVQRAADLDPVARARVAANVRAALARRMVPPPGRIND